MKDKTKQTADQADQNAAELVRQLEYDLDILARRAEQIRRKAVDALALLEPDRPAATSDGEAQFLRAIRALTPAERERLALELAMKHKGNPGERSPDPGGQ